MSVPAQAPVPAEPGQELRRLVAQAREDLARRISVAVERIDVVEAAAVVWPDAGAGCPQPGMRHKQVPVDGARIRLRAAGRTYEYHSGGRRGLFLCERPSKARRERPTRRD
jgi:hypothetical protein